MLLVTQIVHTRQRKIETGVKLVFRARERLEEMFKSSDQSHKFRNIVIADGLQSSPNHHHDNRSILAPARTFSFAANFHGNHRTSRAQEKNPEKRLSSNS